jgi:(1->4)-alpha-D-glucan 1-alpha-D-glucosylmutase
VASDEINYRRFFDINELAALRMQDEAVFESTHRLALNLAADGKVDGLRVDHPDGLYDPAAYFERVQRRYVELCGFERPPAGWNGARLPLYLVAEKIIAGHERLPENWAVHGTTGYRFAAVVNGLFVNGAAREEMERIYRGFVPEAEPFEVSAHEGRQAILRGALASALTMLSTELLRIARSDRNTRDYTLNTLRRALAEVIACFPVYRTYIAGGSATEQDRRYINWALARARRRSHDADVSIFDFIRRVLFAEPGAGNAPELSARIADFTMKFQQLTAPVAAKGVEDTAFYRSNRLVSLNDVGADPEMFGLPVSAFHGASAERAALWPHTLLATSTHDNKRSEDVRARIDVLSEMPSAWHALVQRWERLNRSRKRLIDDVAAPSPNDEYLLYQTLLGTVPSRDIAGEALVRYRARIRDYMIKAVREAKVHTSWTAPGEEYEAAVAAFVEALLGEGDRTRGRFLKELRGEHARFEWFGWLNSLSITLLKFASPGVPDIYQGTELIDLSLVDPDNRRPVDYARRQQALRELEPFASGREPVAGVAASPGDGRAKLWIIWRALQLRAREPDLFARGEYVPLAASGARGEHVVAFARRLGDVGLIAVAGRLWASLGLPPGMPPLGKDLWQDTAVDLAPLGEIREPLDALSLTAPPMAGGTLRLADAFAQFPGALVLCRLAAR